MAVSTINAVMRMRRGLEDDLDISKLQVGEWALSTDTKFVRICYAPNKVIQIASKEAMDETLAEIEQILEDIEQDKLDVEGYMQTTLVYKNAAAASATQASTSATASDSSAEDSEAWAVGKRDGVDVPSTDPAYHNNSKYWAEHSAQSLDNLTDTDISNPSNNDVLKYNSTTQKWENGTGGSGSGGHIIQNAAGTDLAQEAKLQFGGMLKTTDDATNGVTKVSDLAEEIEWSTWNAMTEAEKDAYSAGKKLDILHAPLVQDNKASKTDIATVEPGSTASRAYSVGELVYVNGNLYKVITAIASGATFTVGTNIQSTNVSGTVKDALDGIASKSAGSANNVGTGCKYTYSRSNNEMTIVILQHSGGSNYLFGVWVSDRFNIIGQSGSIITVGSIGPFSLELTINTRYSVTYALSTVPVAIDKAPIGA